jgi:hypothetical protein
MGTICKRRNKEEERKKRQNERKDLTLTGLLMEGPCRSFEWRMVGHYCPSHAPNDPNFRQKLFIWRQGYDWRTEPRPNLKVVGRRLPRDVKTGVYTLFSKESSRNS